ncbi:Spo7-like protein-domain-containing protein [Sphaerosporella brunnea]|uniref:Spo7-like protein-domain-containing protein n=1 Tax=Sphaerosporella brunnea TaxID=1250544 RepID=A0A5J5EIY7_9PEZI|nr:Spo7-like protein-domain-containing protein [Sphaerosporella brunnea]
MSTSSVDPPELDLRIKGSLPSGSAPPSIRHHHHHPPPLQPTNPLETAPSSPSQIYLNLLILEASLRSQYLRHLARRRKFTGFLIALFIWTSIFGYRFFILGGSPYYYVSLLEMLALGGGVFTGVLFYATGLYDKTIVEPRRFVFMANRGLRTYNVKLVKVPLSYREWISWWWGWYTFRPPPQQPSNTTARRRLSSNNRRPTPPVPSHSHSPSISSATRRPSLAPPHQDDEDDEEEVEEYLPGGIHLKLVILPKGFSPDFREGWELYRTEYWEKENEARQDRRLQLKTRRHLKTDYVQPPTERRVRSSRTGSVSSQRVRTPTPDPDQMGIPTTRTRRGSTASVKRRSITGLPSRAGTPGGDISDSSTTSVLGERERARRSDSVRTDKSSSSAGGSLREPNRKPSGRGRGKKRASKQGIELSVDESEGAR